MEALDLSAALNPEALVEIMIKAVGEDLQMPSNYVVIDFETTDLEPEDGHIWQVGFHMVEYGEPECARGCSVLVKAPEQALRDNLFHVKREAMMRTGKDENQLADSDIERAREEYVDMVLTRGAEPADAIGALADMLKAFRGDYLAGHNFINFDVPFLDQACQRHGISLDFDDFKIIDTGMIVKAAQIPTVWTDWEDSWEFYRRVGDQAVMVKYALSEFCENYWKLGERYNLDMREAHDAGFDCYLTSLVLRELVEDARAASR